MFLISTGPSSNRHHEHVSRDIFVQDLPSGIQSTDDIPDDWTPGSLNVSRATVTRAIQGLAQDADFSDPAWGVVRLGGTSIEVNIEDESVDHFALHIRGDDEAANRFLSSLLTSLGLTSALD